MKTKYRKLRVGEIIRATDFMSATSNQGDDTFAKWTEALPFKEMFSSYGGWMSAKTNAGSKVTNTCGLTFVR